MISVIIPTRNSETQLVHCLTSLVPAAAEGILREVIVVDSGSADGTETVADAAGCAFLSVEGAAGEALSKGYQASAKGEWVMFLLPQAQLEAGWHGEVQTAIERLARGERAEKVGFTFTLRHEEYGMRPRLKEMTRALLSDSLGMVSPLQGVLISRQMISALGGVSWLAKQDLSGLSRKTGRRLVRLKAAAVIQSLI